jgi:hypothetical protein
MGLTRSQIIDTSVVDYPRTRAYLLFGDRMPSGILGVVEDRVALPDEPQLTGLLNLAQRIGITRVYQS